MMNQIICQFTFIIVNQELSEPNSVSSSCWVFSVVLNALIFHVTAILGKNWKAEKISYCV
jgi:hypothetical protein